MPSETNRPKLVLIDGTAYIFRAYYAIRNLSNSKGFPTNAIYGFIQMLLKIIKDLAPSHVAVAFDLPGGSFRNELYPEYKANRSEPPEDMIEQIPVIKDIVSAFNLATAEKEGFEADDVIGTLVKKYSDEFEVVIVTGDKDFMQLVGKHVTLLDTMRGKVSGVEEVRERFGVEPERVIEVLGLAGDTSDNVPGIPGIGEKTAIQLIGEFGDLENVIANADKVKGAKKQENIKAYAEQARLSRELVTINCEVPLGVGIGDLKLVSPDRDALMAIFKEMEFHRLIPMLADFSWARARGDKTSELEPDEQSEIFGEETRGFKLVVSEKEIKALAKKLGKAKKLAFDLETTSKDPMQARIVGISFSMKVGEAYYVPLAHCYLGVPDQAGVEKGLELFRKLFEDKKVKKIGQNIKYDFTVLRNHGITVDPITFDTMVASYVLDPSRRQHNLGEISLRFLSRQMKSYKDLVGKGRNARTFDQVTVEEACDYSCDDAETTFKLAEIMGPKLKGVGLWKLFKELEMPLVEVLADMEMAGVKVDEKLLGDLSIELDKELKSVHDNIYSLAGETFNPMSPKQLSRVLFEKLGFNPIRKTKTGFSTDVDVLETLALEHELPAAVLQMRSLAKLKNTYSEALPKLINPRTGRIHTSFNQTVTSTGRLSSSEPNLQNIPVRTEQGRKIREAFIPEKGHVLISADYNQIELRILAHLSGDQVLLDSFKKEQDVHARTASEIFGVKQQDVTSDQRRMAKVINFGIAYGMSAFGLSRQLKIPNSEAQAFIDEYFSRYSGIKAYMDECVITAREKGYVSTIMDRRLYLPDINAKSHQVRAFAERTAINAPMQGSAADIIKKAMLAVHKELLKHAPGARMILQVHDELVLEVPLGDEKTVTDLVRKNMEKAAQLKIPLKVDLNSGPNWSDAH